MRSVKNYLKHVRSQSENVKLMHAVIVSSILTGIFAGVYLYLVRDMRPPTPDILISEPVIYQAEN